LRNVEHGAERTWREEAVAATPEDPYTLHRIRAETPQQRRLAATGLTAHEDEPAAASRRIRERGPEQSEIRLAFE
jgi:hypothetical protein